MSIGLISIAPDSPAEILTLEHSEFLALKSSASFVHSLFFLNLRFSASRGSLFYFQGTLGLRSSFLLNSLSSEDYDFLSQLFHTTDRAKTPLALMVAFSPHCLSFEPLEGELLTSLSGQQSLNYALHTFMGKPEPFQDSAGRVVKLTAPIVFYLQQGNEPLSAPVSLLTAILAQVSNSL